MHKTKLMIVGALAAGVLVAGAVAMHWNQEAVVAYNRENLIRIHIVPNSDDEADQVLKHRVRETVVKHVRPLVSEANDAREAGRAIGENLVLIQQVSEAEVAKAGKDYPVRVHYGTFPFPTRTYGDLTLAAGEYQAVRVTLGAGHGVNWWCVLFPPLCFVNAELQQGPVDAQAGALAAAGPHRLEVKFKVTELWERSSAIAANLAGHLTNKDKEKRS